MTDDTQAKLDKLKRIEAKNRARSQRFIEKARDKGRKQLSAFIDGEAYDQLCRIRDNAIQAGTPTSLGQVIERAIIHYADSLKTTNGKTSVNIDGNTNQDKKPIQETQTEIPGPKKAESADIFDFIKKEGIDLNGITDDHRSDDRFKIALELTKLYPHRKQATERYKSLVDLGILETKKQLFNLQNRAKKWAEKTGYTP